MRPNKRIELTPGYALYRSATGGVAGAVHARRYASKVANLMASVKL
jgi:hypothetical protein